MGFHNPAEVGSTLTDARAFAESALQNAQAAQPAIPLPVPIPPTMTVAPSTSVPGELVISYDVSTCNAADHVLVIGQLGDFRTVTSATCSIGSTGAFSIAPPSDNVWFAIAGVTSGAYSSIGQATSGERSVIGLPALCPALASQEVTAVCPTAVP